MTILGTSIILQIIKAYSKFASLHTNEIDLCLGFISCFVIKHPDESTLRGIELLSPTWYKGRAYSPHKLSSGLYMLTVAQLYPHTNTQNNQLSVLCKHLERERSYLAHSSMLSSIMAGQSQQ